MSILPSPIDPNHIGVNILYYDTDSDQTAKSRIGWSVWGGVQGDPYRTGRSTILSCHWTPSIRRIPRNPLSRP